MNYTSTVMEHLDRLEQICLEARLVYGVHIDVELVNTEHELYMIYLKTGENRMHSMLCPMTYYSVIRFFLDMAMTISKYKNLGVVGGTNAAPTGDIWAS